MKDLVLFCKTYNGDIERFKILKKSTDKFNFDKIPFYVICPKKDKELFLSLKTGKENYDYNIVTDEEVLSMSSNESHKQNWYSQQVIKLSFYKLGLCKHYFILDSDCYFIRDFKIKDYIFDENTPYLPLTEPLKGAETNFMQLFRSIDNKNDEKLWNTGSKNYINREGKRFCLNLPCVFSTDVLKDMEKKLLEKNNLTYQKLIEINPFEFEWYCDYIIKYKPINYIVCTPFFISFYTQTLYTLYRYLGWTEKTLAHYYTGLIMHEGYIKDFKYKSSIIGSFIRKLILINYFWHKDKNSKNKEKLTFKKKLKSLKQKYIKIPLKTLFAKIK